MSDEDLIPCLHSLNSAWQSAEEMLKTSWMLVKNWAFHRYTDCFIDLLIETENISEYRVWGLRGALFTEQ